MMLMHRSSFQYHQLTGAGRSYKDEEFSSQIGAVYPLIRKKAKSLSCFEDYSYVMKKDHYTDSCCHMNEYGNKEIAKKFAKSLFKFLPTE